MIQGHGDDAFRFERPIVANFSSNVYSKVDLEALKAHLRGRLDAIGHYPEPEPFTLEAALASLHGIDPAAVCATNGATEAIYLTAQAFSGSRSTILQPTFSEYKDACSLHGHRVTASPGECPPGDPPHFVGPLPFREPKSPGGHSPADCGSATRALIWLCNPNNPTGSVIPKQTLVAAIDDNPETIFVIDQSYGFFTREPLMTAAEAAGRPNVIQLHSMTKRYAMPGIRLGYIVGNTQLLSRIRSIRMPWSVNALAIEAGLYLCGHPDTAPIDLESLFAETRRLRDALNVIPGLEALPTLTHFFLCRMAEGRAADLKKWLAGNHGILIRDASNFEGLDERYFRIATQTPEQNDLLVAAITQYLEGRR